MYRSDGLQIAHNNNKKAAEKSVGWRTPLRYALLSVDSEGRIHHDKRRRDVCATPEPLLGPLPGLNLEGIDWVIVGGESGPGARPMDPAWVTGIRDQCLSARVPFFFKQWGGTRKKRAGRELEGRTWDEMPAMATAMAL
jgi:protein gp37